MKLSFTDADRTLDLTESKSLAVLFPKQFMNKHSKFDSIIDLFNNCGIVVKNTGDFHSLKNGKYDSEIAANTDFSGWDTMSSAAIEELFASKTKD
ncbi:MAG: hypothetical protein K1W18_11500 [Oscillospiraceae bacterium]